MTKIGRIILCFSLCLCSDALATQTCKDIFQANLQEPKYAVQCQWNSCGVTSVINAFRIVMQEAGRNAESVEQEMHAQALQELGSLHGFTASQLAHLASEMFKAAGYRNKVQGKTLSPEQARNYPEYMKLADLKLSDIDNSVGVLVLLGLTNPVTQDYNFSHAVAYRCRDGALELLNPQTESPSIQPVWQRVTVVGEYSVSFLEKKGIALKFAPHEPFYSDFYEDLGIVSFIKFRSLRRPAPNP